MHILDFLALSLKLFLTLELAIGFPQSLELAAQGFDSLIALLKLLLIGLLKTFKLPSVLPLNTFSDVFKALICWPVLTHQIHG